VFREASILPAVFVLHPTLESLDEARLLGVQQQTKGVNHSEDSTCLLSTEQHHIRKHKTLKWCDEQNTCKRFLISKAPTLLQELVLSRGRGQDKIGQCIGAGLHKHLW